jgi:hypothetical protein
VQDDITRRVVGAAAVTLTRFEREHVFTKPTENLAAYEFVLRGREFWSQPSRDKNDEAAALFQRAIDLDPSYAAAYAALGNSHFFGRGTVECNATGAKNPSFVLEDPNFMYMILPTAGVCPASTTPVYRVFSNRPDANHRYMTDRAIRDAMVAKGWVAEGDGPDLVVMCAP